MATTAEIAAWSAALTLIKTGFNATAVSVNAGSAAILPFAAQFQPLILSFNDVVSSQNALGPAIVEAIRQIGLLVPSDPPIVPAGLTLTAPVSALAGNPVTVSWTGLAPRSASDWIGLYPVGAAHTAWISWKYLPLGTETTSFVIPGSVLTGTYEFRLFPLNGYSLAATSGPVAVTQLAIAPPIGPSTKYGTVIATTNNPPCLEVASKMTQARVTRVGTRTGFLADGNEIYERDNSLDWIRRPTTGTKPPLNTVFAGLGDNYYGWCGADVIAQGAVNPPMIGKFYRCKRTTWAWEVLPVVFPGVIAMLSLANNILIPDPERNQLCLLLGSATEFWTLKPDTLEIERKPTVSSGFWFSTAIIVPGTGKIHQLWDGVRSIDILTGQLTVETPLLEDGTAHQAIKAENYGLAYVPAENAIYNGTISPSVSGLFGRFNLTSRRFTYLDAASVAQSYLLFDGTRLETGGGFTNPPFTSRVYDLPIPPLPSSGGNIPTVIVPPIVITEPPVITALPIVKGTLTSFALPADSHLPFGKGFECKHVVMADCPIDEFIYIQGGDYDLGSAMDGTWRLNKKTGEFTKIVGDPVPAIAPHALQDGALMQWRSATQKVFTGPGVFAPYDDKTGGFASTDFVKYPKLAFARGCFELDVKATTWEQNLGLFGTRGDSSGSRFGGVLDDVNDLLVMLGDDSSGLAARRWDLKTNTRLPDITYSLARNPLAVATYFSQTRHTIVGRWVYALGYSTDGANVFIPRFVRWGLDSHVIEDLPPPPYPGLQESTRLATSSGKVVWIRTVHPAGDVLNILIYDPTTKVWSQDMTRPTVGNFLVNSEASMFDGQIVMGGGSGGMLRQTHIWFYTA